MIFDCGPQEGEEGQSKEERWHRWFAWYPVRVSARQCAWLQTVERKGVWSYDWDGGSWIWEHRL